jgi:GT2 family glycosyltransferase
MVMPKSAWRDVRNMACTERDIYEDTDLAIHVKQAGYNCIYYPPLKGSMSARRYDDSPLEFYRYINLYRKTYSKHGLRGAMPEVAILIYLAFYFVMYPVRRSYDEQTGKRSLRQLIRGHVHRKHPMSER